MLDRIADLSKINNKRANFNSSLKRQYYAYLIDNFGVLFTFQSNIIAGTNIALPLNNTYDFKNIIDNNKKREIKEIINHQNAFKYIFDILNKSEDIILIIIKYKASTIS